MTGDGHLKKKMRSDLPQSSETQKEAIEKARELVEKSGGGELVTHGRDGKIREKDTIPPAKDPFPPRG
jgi:hypothetical protein